MLNILFRWILCCSLCWQLPLYAGLAAGTHALQLQGADGRDYLLHVPRSYQPGQPAPLLLVLHGGGGNRHIQATEAFYHQISASEQYGYVVVFPNGYSRLPGGKMATWNAGRCCGAAAKRHVDDVAVLRQVIAEVQQQLRIDAGRIFVDGMSNGAMMSYRLACELSGTIRGIAAVAGTDNTTQCQPSRPVAILHVHAKDDDHVPFNGGEGGQSMVDVDFTSVNDTIQKWVHLNQAQPQPQRVLSVNGAYCDLYAASVAPVQLCVTETGGHAWPGGHNPRGGAAGSQALDANAVIWQFFQQLPPRPPVSP